MSYRAVSNLFEKTVVSFHSASLQMKFEQRLVDEF